MIIEALLATTAAAAGGLVYARSQRSSLYRQLTGRIDHIAATHRPEVGGLLQRPTPDFGARIAVLHDVLPIATLQELTRQAQHLVRPERSYIPTHKKGGTVAYETLFEEAPAIVGLYHSKEMTELISRVTGLRVRPTPIYDQSSLSVLFYEKPGDHIGWHYDHNFYRGRHFTVLLPVVNQGSGPGGLSHATLRAKVADRETDVATPPNTLVVFEGARVHHKVTPIVEGERRLVISMTYCTDPRANVVQGAIRRIKDVAFFGPRALWT
ncbi:MAG: 2OG-Fe(II) oxygenase [Hyphomicrobiaceae bacterium]|nr:2OG-Fe(II) oxygenase [Hyphomicrobiaceae bacterium]